MKFYMRWLTQDRRNGRAPGEWTTLYAARIAANAFMTEHPTVTWVAVYDDTDLCVAEYIRAFKS